MTHASRRRLRRWVRSRFSRLLGSAVLTAAFVTAGCGDDDLTPEASLSLDRDLREPRCALWRFVPAERRIAYILDLPSRGDTCFASVLDGASPDEVIVYDYSSPIDGPDVAWNVGQEGETRVYRHVLRFTPR